MNPDILHKWPCWRFTSIKRLVHMLATVLRSVKKPKAHTEQKVSYLFDTYGDAVLRAAYAYLHNMDDAEDVLQDTFVQYLRAERVFESSAHEKAWLLRGAINLSKNKLNSIWYKRTDALTEAYPCAELDDELACVWDAVRSLPPKYREPIHLFYHEGYSTAEIAEILKMKETTVRSILHRGRGMLKDILKEAYDFDDEI